MDCLNYKNWKDLRPYVEKYSENLSIQQLEAANS